MVTIATVAVPAHRIDRRLRDRSGRLAAWLSRQSLARQFLLVGSVVSVFALLLVGAAVTSLIERAVTRNAGATTALYVDSIIAPLLPDMQSSRRLNEGVQRALDETLGQGALGGRIAEMRLWGRDGTVLYSTQSSLVGRRLDQPEAVARAFTGQMVVRYHGPEAGDTADDDHAHLEIYNPILQPWSGEVVAVIEFHEHADEFAAALGSARWRSWAAVAGVIAIFFMTLSAIVLRGSRTIDSQAIALKRQVAELTQLLDQNQALHSRVQTAAKRVATLNESHLRRIGADLHDGPAQLIALASLKLDGQAVVGEDTSADRRADEVRSIRACLDDALGEIRAISHGLVLPHIESATLPELVAHPIEAFERRTGKVVARQVADASPELTAAERICIYRFLQEALSNGHRHSPKGRLTVTAAINGGVLALSVSDDGPGFEPDAIPPHSIGLAGLRDRVESLGGQFTLHSTSAGTTLSAALPLEYLARP